MAQTFVVESGMPFCRHRDPSPHSLLPAAWSRSMPLPLVSVLDELGRGRQQRGPDAPGLCAAGGTTLTRPFNSGGPFAPFRVINIVNAGEVFIERLNQIDLRFSKIVRAVGTRTQVNFDFYNVTNSNSIIGQNASFGPGWRTPTNILLPRLFKISAQFDWN